MADKLTLDQVKTLLGEIVKEHMESGEFVTLKVLKDELKETLEKFVREDDIAEFKAALEKLKELPGPNGEIKLEDGHLKGLQKDGGYECFAEFAKDVYLAGQHGGQPSPRFDKWFADVSAYNKAVKAAGSPTLEIGDPEQGGYLTPPEFSRTLMERGFSNSNFMSKCTKVPMAINQIGMPYVNDFTHTSYLHGAMMAYWLDEKAQKTATKPKFGKITLSLNKLVVLVFSSDELLEDSIISMQPLLSEKAGDVIAWKVDEAIIRGTGAGQPLGVIGATNPSRVQVNKRTGQAAATIIYENIIDMYSRLYPPCLRNAVWVSNNQAFPQLAVMALPVGTGGAPAYLPANGASGRPYDSLMGREMIISEHMSTLGTVGDIGLFDFTQYLIGQKRGRGAGIQYATSIHLKFDYDQTAFRFVFRIDGQPWWPAVFTPKRGNTESPFIVLQARS